MFVMPTSDFILLRKGGNFVCLLITLNTEVDLMNISCVNKSPIRQILY